MAGYVPRSESQRGSLLFCYFLHKKFDEAHQMLVEAYGVHAMGRTQCYEWFKRFAAGEYEVSDKPHGRPPRKFGDEELEALLQKNCA